MKMFISLSSAQIKPPDSSNVIFMARAPVQHFPAMKDSLILIPHQTNEGKVPDSIAHKLNELKPIGYDWQPEKLKHMHLQGNLTFYIGSSYHYESEVANSLADQGFTVKDIEITVEQFEALFEWYNSGTRAKADPTSSDIEALHKRVRWMWKHHHTQFTQWESGFVLTVGKELAKGKTLTHNRETALNRMFKRYNVPMEASASDDDRSALALRWLKSMTDAQRKTYFDLHPASAYRAAYEAANEQTKVRTIPDLGPDTMGPLGTVLKGTRMHVPQDYVRGFLGTMSDDQPAARKWLDSLSAWQRRIYKKLHPDSPLLPLLADAPTKKAQIEELGTVVKKIVLPTPAPNVRDVQGHYLMIDPSRTGGSSPLT